MVFNKSKPRQAGVLKTHPTLPSWGNVNAEVGWRGCTLTYPGVVQNENVEESNQMAEAKTLPIPILNFVIFVIRLLFAR